MQQILNWFRSWMGLAAVSRSMSSLQRKIILLQREKQQSDRELIEERETLRRLQDQIAETVKRQNQAVARAEGLNKRLEEALSSASEALKTANDIVIPGLVAANQLFVDRWEAESSVWAMRQVMAKKDTE